MPSFDAGWDFVAQLNISWPFQLRYPLPPPSFPYSPWLNSVYVPTVVHPHSLHAADATERFH